MPVIRKASDAAQGDVHIYTFDNMGKGLCDRIPVCRPFFYLLAEYLRDGDPPDWDDARRVYNGESSSMGADLVAWLRANSWRIPIQSWAWAEHHYPDLRVSL
jgi:hypothetical protein